MNSTNLLPCPFCGQRDIPIKNENPGDLSGGYFIECPDCGASTCIRYACGDDPRPLLAATWNRRTPGQCLHQISEPAAVAPQGVEPSALTKSIRELDDWEDRADDEVLTPSECESVMLVLHELKRLRSQPAAVAGPALDARAVAAAVCQRVAELPDRSSPQDWPEAMLVTGPELIDAVACEIEQAQAAPADDMESEQCRCEPSEWSPPPGYDGDGSVAGLARAALAAAPQAQHQGMAVAGDGAAELGKLIREQWDTRSGIYPDGNPNSGQP